MQDPQLFCQSRHSQAQRQATLATRILGQRTSQPSRAQTGCAGQGYGLAALNPGGQSKAREGRPVQPPDAIEAGVPQVADGYLSWACCRSRTRFRTL